MQKFIKKQIGKEIHNFVVEGDNLFEVMQQAGKLSFPNVYKCGICGKDHLFLGSHTAQGKYKYVTIKCGSCKASLNFGQQQEDPDTFYLQQREENGEKVFNWKPFEAKDSQ